MAGDVLDPFAVDIDFPAVAQAFQVGVLLEMRRLLVAQRRYAIESGELFPIDSVVGVFPFEGHAVSPW